MLRDKSFKTGPGPVTESIPASPGIEGGAGSNPLVAAPNVGALSGQWPVLRLRPAPRRRTPSRLPTFCL